MLRVRKAICLLSAACLCVFAGCHGSGPSAPSGWAVHATPSGLHFALPPGWNAQGDANGRVNITGSTNQQGVLWPVFIRHPLDSGAAQAVARTLGKKVWPSASWSALPASGNVVRMEGRDQQRTGMLVFSWVPTDKGTAGMLHVGDAPTAEYGKDAPVFAQIFSSVSIQGADMKDDAAQAKTIQYVRWRDPREGAFTVEVPQGWRTEGGMIRYAAIDTRPAVQVHSPDGQVMLMMGDASLPGFTEPTQMLAMAGMGEGSWYDLGAGVRLMVRRYESGPQFASGYARQASKLCSNVRVGAPRSRNDLTDAVNRQYSQYQATGIFVQLNAGEVALTCSKEGKPYNGYVFAATQLTRGQGIAMWYVAYLFAYVAPAARDAEAHAELKHMGDTFRIDPQWQARQSQTTMAVSRINAQTAQQVSDTIMSGYESRQKTMDEISRRRENAILGEVDVVDAGTGQRYKVDNSSNYYWVDGQGNIVGTQTHTRPEMNFEQMMQLP